jgi:alpha-tubulin suppressor-like RCC1 family protein
MKTDGGTLTPLTGITAIAAGGDFSLALDVNGGLWAWGNNGYGQLGVPLATTPTVDNKNISTTAIQVTGFPAGITITKIAAGVAHSLAIDQDGKIWAWGYNAFSQLGDGTKINSFMAVPAVNVNNLINSLTSGIATEIAAGSAHSLVIINGSVYAWGYNFYGQLGNGAALKSEVPVPTPQIVKDLSNTALTGISTINAIGFQNMAVDGNNGVWTWGYNGYGQLGDGTTTDRSLAQKVSFP